MTTFIIATRLVGGLKQRVAFNVAHVVAVYPATDFHLDGKVTEADGADIWTSIEAGSQNASPWRVLESWDDISKQITQLSMRGA